MLGRPFALEAGFTAAFTVEELEKAPRDGVTREAAVGHERLSMA